MKKRLPPDSRFTGIILPPIYRQQARQIQLYHDDISLAQVWRMALRIGLDRLLKDIPKPPPEQRA